MNADVFLRQLDQKDLAPLREKLHQEQDEICPILKQKFPVQEMVVDHQHRRSNSTIGKNGGGLVRGVIHRQANAFEGKVAKNFVRCGLHHFDIPLPEVLRALADYYERGALSLIHPNEKPKAKLLGKRLYAKIAKAYSSKYPNRKPLEYPKSSKNPKKVPLLSSKWLKLMEEFNITEE